MRKRETIWIAILLVLGVTYYHYFGHKKEKPIVILAAWHPALSGGAMHYVISFTLNDNFKLTKLEVAPVDEDGKVDPATPPSWNLVSESNSAPTRAFAYGQHIHGMKPALANVKPAPLTPGVVYRIMISAGTVNGSADFTARGE
jgi:hypothetical protein